MRTAEMAQHVLERAGCPLHYWLTGADRAPWVVFTHGATVDHGMFDLQVAEVARQYRVLAWDVRGHGRSQPIGDGFSIGGAVEDLLAILDVVGAREATFVGQSMGGNITQELVFRYPERVTTLAVIGCTCTTCRQSSLDRLLLRLSPTVLRLYPDGALRRAFARAAGVKPETRAYLYAASRQVSRQDFFRIWSALVDSLHYEPGYSIRQPFLLTHGEHDRTGNIRTIAPRWAAREPHCRYVVIPEAGHNANQDNPAFFNRLLLDFLGEHVPLR